MESWARIKGLFDANLRLESRARTSAKSPSHSSKLTVSLRVGLSESSKMMRKVPEACFSPSGAYCLEAACKPDSVPGDHSSRRRVTALEYQEPTDE
jgi:hypothetical protein